MSSRESAFLFFYVITRKYFFTIISKQTVSHYKIWEQNDQDSCSYKNKVMLCVSKVLFSTVCWNISSRGADQSFLRGSLKLITRNIYAVTFSPFKRKGMKCINHFCFVGIELNFLCTHTPGKNFFEKTFVRVVTQNLRRQILAKRHLVSKN